MLMGIGFVIAISVLWESLAPVRAANPEPTIAGVTLDVRRAPEAAELADLQRLGASHVAVIPYAWVSGTEVHFNPDGRWFSESQHGIRALADGLTEHDIGLIVKPQIWLGQGGFAGDLEFASDAEWSAWEAGYAEYALYYAAVAEEVGAPVFVVGSELTRSALDRPDFWRGLIKEVRASFSGTVVYAANWYAEVDSVMFWDELDLIGVQGYYPLSTDPDPSLEALAQGWIEPTESLRSLAQEWDRQVLFTEIGYRSAPGAAAEPWIWTPRNSEETPDPALQERLFRAFFQGPWREPWIRGAVVWKWYGHGARTGSHSVDFTPQNKPAEGVIRNAFRDAVQRTR